MLEDADEQVLFARFFEQEGTLSTLTALKHVLVRFGRFGEFCTDRGSHFCRTGKAGEAPADEQHGQVSRVLRALGIRHILARSPEARGRSERAFGTIQGRLPQDLRLAGIRSYQDANAYLEKVFVPEFNRRFTVAPAQRTSLHAPRRRRPRAAAHRPERTRRPQRQHRRLREARAPAAGLPPPHPLRPLPDPRPPVPRRHPRRQLPGHPHRQVRPGRTPAQEGGQSQPGSVVPQPNHADIFSCLWTGLDQSLRTAPRFDPRGR